MRSKLFVFATVASCIALSGLAQASDYGLDRLSHRLQNAVKVKRVRTHQAIFQLFADFSGGTRVAGTTGYNLSAKYVAALMRYAGYEVQVQKFIFTSYRPLGPSTLEQTGPDSVVYEEDVDYTLMSQTEPGNVIGSVTAVDLKPGLGNASDSGCEAEDFIDFPASSIALIQRGGCSFRLKAENAAAADAIGAIIFNQGNTEDRKGLINATLSADYAGGIPVFFATTNRGEEWSEIEDLELRIVADVLREDVPTTNVIASSVDGDDDNVVVVGAHLDSVPEGPGIQDNGSGSAAILEVALQMARKLQINKKGVLCHARGGHPRTIRARFRRHSYYGGPYGYKSPYEYHLAHGDTPGPCEGDTAFRNKVRFAWWAAEESGLVGSDNYVFGLTDEELAQIALYLNFDMIGSPNFARFVYDGDGSAFGLSGPPGSAAVEALYEDFYAKRGLASEPTEISFRSDYAAFFDSDIPFGGLFTGAEGIKTPEQVDLYGGTAGEQYDPCYHLACDTFDNISLEVLDLNSDAVAHSTVVYTVSDLAEALAPPASAATSRALRATESAVVERRGDFYVR